MKIQLALEKKLKEGLKPLLLEVQNESPSHNVPQGSESHFRILAVSAAFKGLSPVQRHKKVYQMIQEEMASIHAFSQSLFTEEEWRKEGGSLPSSPPCRRKN